MKKLLICLLFGLAAVPAYSQNEVPMFETDEPVANISQTEKNPNIGRNAKNVDSVKIAPMLPAVGVSAGDNQQEQTRPFSRMNLHHIGAKPVAPKEEVPIEKPIQTYSENVSQPVDFSAQIGKKIQIVVEEKEEPQVAAQTEQMPVFKKPEKKQKNEVSVKIADPEKMKSFNIADIYLGMDPEETIDSAADNGFELTNVAYGIPSFMVTDFERDCRASGLYQTRLIHECVRDAAQDEDVYYVSQLVFERNDSHEKIVVLFSSALTDNKAFKIDYTALGDNSLGTSYKDLLKKTHRRDIFWKYVYDKYGKPAGKNMYFWGNPKKIYLRAFMSGNALDGRIVLEDTEQTGADYIEAENQNKEKDPHNPFHF